MAPQLNTVLVLSLFLRATATGNRAMRCALRERLAVPGNHRVRLLSTPTIAGTWQ